MTSRGKGRRERLVPFGRVAAQAIEAYLPHRARWLKRVNDDEEPIDLGNGVVDWWTSAVWPRLWLHDILAD